jgi:Protein of unknown function (DUF3631)
MTGDDRQALGIARGLAEAGIPVFVAYPDPGHPGKYRLPARWQATTANPAYVDAWKPGLALCAVMGCGLDLVDIDPRNGGTAAALDGILPEVLGEAASPSGGQHFFVASMGVGVRDGVLPGIDIKAGTPDGQHRGFAFIAPTVRKSKVTGQPAAYQWVKAPDLSRLGTGDPSCELARLVRQARGEGSSPGFSQPGGHSEGWTDPDIAQLIREGIPAGVPQHPALRDVVARLNGQGYDRTGCWGIWQAIVDRTTLTDPGWPWAEPDFTTMYDSAASKYGTRPRAAAAGAAPGGDGLDGAQLLGELRAALTRYVILPSAHAAVAVTLWIAATHAQGCWENATRLVIKSPEKRCGKSRLLDVIAATCHAALITVNISAAALARSIGDDPPTLLLDEADTVFGKKAADNNEDLRGIINAGHQRNRPYVRWDPFTRGPESCPTFAMAALAGIGDLPDTIEDRAVTVAMQRRAPGETVQPYRERRDAGPLRELGAQLGAWVSLHLDGLRQAEPGLPVEDRAADNWEPLIALADLAGGQWPAEARAAAVALTADAEESDADAMRLLGDLRDVFGVADAMHGSTLLGALHKIDEAPWGDYFGKPLTARALASLLRPYGVRPRDVWLDGVTRKGYYRADLWGTWERYGHPSARSARSATSQLSLLADENSETLGPLGPSGPSGSANSSASGVTSQNADLADLAEDPPSDAGALALLEDKLGAQVLVWPEDSAGWEANQ